MPTSLRIGPYRFFFYAGDRNEPLHIHVQRDNNEAKYWLSPLHLLGIMDFQARDCERSETL
jgi:hypothetical protein